MLLKKTKTETDDKSSVTSYDVNSSLIKIFIIIALATASAFTLGYFIANPHPVFSIIAIAVFFAFFILQVLFIKKPKRIIATVFFESLAILLPIIMVVKLSISFNLIIVWMIFVFFMALAEYSGVRTIKNSLRVPFFRVAKTIIVNLTIGLVIFITLLYLFIPVPANSPLDNASRTIADVTIVPLVGIFIPEFTLDKTIGELIEITARSSVDKNEVTSNTTEGEKEALVSAVEEEYASFVEQYIGEFDPNHTPTTIIANFAEDFMSGPESSGEIYLNIIFLIAALFLLRGVAYAIYIPIVIVTLLIYETLIVFNFVSMEYESKSREILILK